MDESEILERAAELPGHYADRLSEAAFWSVQRMCGGGEYGEMTIELAASLAASGAAVTAQERDELLALLSAMGMPTEPVARLNVRD